MGNHRLRGSSLLLIGVCLCSCISGAPPRPIERSAPPPIKQRPPERSEIPRQPVLVGTVIKVTDGDTIKVQLSSGPITVRFDSIDAPEKNQPWGMEAHAALARRVDQQEVALDVTTQDRYERLVATVYVRDANINSWMVQQGHAWAYREYMSEAQYCRWEGAARSASLGLWALTESYAPWEWRDKERRESCMINGNISSNGRIYHVPGSSAYDSTIIDESKGERWFCTVEEAERAGWRPPR